MSKSNVKINPSLSKKNDICNSDDIKSWGTEMKPNNTSSRCRRGENLVNIKDEWEHQHKIDLKKSGCSYWRCNGVVAAVFKYCTWWCASQPVQACQSGSPSACN